MAESTVLEGRTRSQNKWSWHSDLGFCMREGSVVKIIRRKMTVLFKEMRFFRQIDRLSKTQIDFLQGNKVVVN